MVVFEAILAFASTLAAAVTFVGGPGHVPPMPAAAPASVRPSVLRPHSRGPAESHDPYSNKVSASYSTSEEFPIDMMYTTNCATTYKKIGCFIPLWHFSVHQEARIQCRSAVVAALSPGVNEQPFGQAQTGIVPAVSIAGNGSFEVAVSTVGFRSTAFGPEYDAVVACDVVVGHPAGGGVVALSQSPQLQNAKPRQVPRLELKRHGDTTIYPMAELNLVMGGTKVTVVNEVALDQNSTFFFSTFLPSNTPAVSVIIENMDTGAGSCDPLAGVPYALISSVIVDGSAIQCQPTGVSDCGAVLCSLAGGSTSLVVEMTPHSLGSTDQLLAGITVTPST